MKTDDREYEDEFDRALREVIGVHPYDKTDRLTRVWGGTFYSLASIPTTEW